MNIITARVTFVMVGYGDLTLTDESLYWNKSATSLLTFGAGNAMTDNHFNLPLSEIINIETYTYFPGGGLSVTDNKGKVYKFSFKHKKELKIMFEYLKNRMGS